MERKKQEAVLEAILFTMGESVELKRLAELIDASPKKTKEILQGVRDIIYRESNNVILLSTIASVAMQFPQKLPGLVLDLASSIDIVLWDLTRHGKVMQK